MKMCGTQVQRQRKHGFTLIELLVVIALISLMAGLGGGMFMGTLERLKLDKAASNLFLAAKYARMMAVEQQRRYRLCLDDINNGFFLVTTLYDEQTGQIEDVVVSDPYCKPFSFEDNIRFEQIEITSTDLDWQLEYENLPAVVFKPDGTAQSAVIQVGNDKMHYTVSVNAATGKAKLIPGTAENVTVSTIDLDAE